MLLNFDNINPQSNAPSSAAAPVGQTNFDDVFAAAEQEYGVPAELLKRQMMAESGGRVDAKSEAGAVGLMQFLPSTAKEIGINPLDPVDAIMGAAYKLRTDAEKRYGGDLALAVAAYHGGYDKKGWGPKTLGYVDKIFGQDDFQIIAKQVEDAAAAVVSEAPKEKGLLERFNDFRKERQQAVNDSLDQVGLEQNFGSANANAAQYAQREQKALERKTAAELANKVEGPVSRGEVVSAIADQPRTKSDIARDVALQLVQGAKQIVATPAGLVSPGSDFAQSAQKGIRDTQAQLSNVTKANLESADMRIKRAAEGGTFEELKAAVAEYGTNPVLMQHFITTTLPSMAGVMAPAKFAQVIAAARGIEGAGLAAVGANTIGASNAALNAGGARQEAYDSIYQALVQQGVSPEEAKNRAENESLLSAVVGAGTGWFAKYGAEAPLVNAGVNRAIGKGGVIAATKAGAGVVGREVLSEQAEEVLPQAITNAMVSKIDGSNPLAGLPSTAVQTAIAAGPMSALGAAIEARNAYDPLGAELRGFADAVERTQFTALDLATAGATPSQLANAPITPVEVPNVPTQVAQANDQVPGSVGAGSGRNPGNLPGVGNGGSGNAAAPARSDRAGGAVGDAGVRTNAVDVDQQDLLTQIENQYLGETNAATTEQVPEKAVQAQYAQVRQEPAAASAAEGVTNEGRQAPAVQQAPNADQNGVQNQGQIQPEPAKTTAAVPGAAQGGNVTQGNKVKNRRAVLPESDSALVAIAKLGGMDTQQLLTNGFDQSDISVQKGAKVSKKTGQLGKAPFRAKSVGFNMPIHRNGGMSFDGMREALVQYGYLPQDASVNDAIELLRSELRGEPVYTASAQEAMAREDNDARQSELAAEQMANDELGLDEEYGSFNRAVDNVAEVVDQRDAFIRGMRSAGLTEEEINEATIEAFGNGEVAAGPAEEGAYAGRDARDQEGQADEEAFGGTEGTAPDWLSDFTLEGQTNEQAASAAKQTEPEITKEQIDRERDAVPFSLATESQPKPVGVQGGLKFSEGESYRDKKPSARAPLFSQKNENSVIANVSGKDLSAEQITPENVIDVIRTYYRNSLRDGDTVTRQGFGTVRFSKKGLDELRYGIKKDLLRAKLLPAVPDIIRDGEYHGREELTHARHDKIVAFHFFSGDVIVDGNRVTAGVTVGEDAFGNLFYNVTHDQSIGWKAREAHLLPRAEASGGEPQTDDRSSVKMSVDQDESNINIFILSSLSEQNRNGQSSTAVSDRLRSLFRSPSKFDSIVSVVQSVNDLPDGLRGDVLSQTGDGSTVQGFAHNGKVYLIADNLRQGKELSVFLHELGGHIGMRNMLGESNFNKLIGQINAWAADNSKSLESQIAKLAKRKAEQSSSGNTDEEVLAYFIESAIDSGINPTALKSMEQGGFKQFFTKLMEALRVAMQKIGLGNFDALTSQDIVDLAYGAAGMELGGKDDAESQKFDPDRAHRQMVSRLKLSDEDNPVGFDITVHEQGGTMFNPIPREFTFSTWNGNDGVSLNVSEQNGEYGDVVFSSSLEAYGDQPKGTGIATKMYLSALNVAQKRGIGWMSEGVRSDESLAMYRRLKAAGIPFVEVGNASYISADSLNGVDLQAVADRLGNKRKDTITVDGVERPTLNSNGKPIAQTEEGLRNFWRWFGNSRVVDADGRPLVVYHGTASDITEFDIGRSGESTGNTGFYGAGAYFSEDADYASGFSFWARRSEDQAPNVVPVYLSLKNPAYINITPRLQAAIDESRATAEKIIGTLTNRGADQAVIDKLRNLVSENKFEPFMGTLYNALGGGSGTTALLKDAGFDGVTIYGGISGKEKLAEAVAFNPTQIKSATGNNGDFDGSNPDIRYSQSRFSEISDIQRDAVSRAIDRAIAIEQGKDVPQVKKDSALLKLRSLRKRLDEGKIEVGAFVFEVNQLHQNLENASAAKKYGPIKERERGADYIRERLLQAKRRGEIDTQVADMTEWFILQNPDLVQDLGISVRTASEEEQGSRGRYIPAVRVIRLFKDNAADTTGIHEILHHLERMMPEELRAAIRKEYNTRIANMRKGADANTLAYLDKVLEIATGNMKSQSDAIKMIQDGKVPYAMYQYLNTSEFWAVNGAALMGNRYAAKDSAFGKIKQWFGEFLQKIKSVLGMKSDAPIIKAMNEIMAGNGEYVSKDMLSMSSKFFSVASPSRNASGQQIKQTWNEDSQTDAMAKRERFIYQVQDKFVDLKRARDAIRESGIAIRDEFDPYIVEETFHGAAAYRVQTSLEQEFQPILEEMKLRSIKLEDFDKYLHARHAKERNAAMAKRNPNQAELDQMISDMADAVLQATDPKEAARLETKLRHLQNTKPFSGTEEQRNMLSGMSNKEADAYLAGLGSRRGSYDALGQKIDDIVAENRRLMLQYGLETADTVNALENAYSHYVPLMREMDESDLLGTGGSGVGAGYSVRGSALKQATGSLRKVESPLANLFAQREQIIVRGEKMKVGRAVYGLALTAPNPDFWSVIVPGKMTEAQMRASLVAAGIDSATIQNMTTAPVEQYVDEETGMVRTRVNPLLSRDPNAFIVRIHGEDRVILFNSKNDRATRLAAALKNADMDQVRGPIDWSLNKIGAVTRWISSVNTQYNPIFGLKNFIRDLQAAVLNASTTDISDRKFKLLRDALPAVVAIMKMERGVKVDPEWSRLWNQMQADGGLTGYRDQFNGMEDRIKAINKQLKGNKLLDKTGLGYVLDLLSDYNTAIESGVRLIAYREALDKGLSRQKSASIAKNITVNFNRKGRSAPTMSKLYAFFNAAVQGNARIIETAQAGHKGKAAYMAASKLVGAGVSLGVIYTAVGLVLMGDDWEDIPEFVRERELVIPIGKMDVDGPNIDQTKSGYKYIHIPMALGYHAIPNIGRNLVEAMYFSDGAADRALNAVSTAIDAMNPMGGGNSMLEYVLPSFLDPVAQLAANENAFGRPIAKQPFSDKDTTPGPDRFFKSASTLGKMVSLAFDRITGGDGVEAGKFSPTPDQVDFVFGQVTGGVGREGLKLYQYLESKITGEKIPESRIPVLGMFYGETKSEQSMTGKFYEIDKKVALAKKQIEAKNGIEAQTKYVDSHPEARIINDMKNAQSELRKLQKARKSADERGDKDEVKRLDGLITGVKIFVVDRYNEERAKK